MIPSTSTFLGQDLELREQPTLTYKMNTSAELVRGYTDKLDAVKQAIYKILNTERYQYAMYSPNYGIELNDLFGEPVSYVCPELERRITEALTWDDRINSVDNFEFGFPKKGEVLVSFTAHTTFGDAVVEKAVNF